MIRYHTIARNGPRTPRRGFGLLSLFILLAAAVPLHAGELRLIPYPQSVAITFGELALRAPLRVALHSSRAEDRFAAESFLEELKEVRKQPAAIVGGAAIAPIMLGRPGDPVIDREMARRRLNAAVLEKPESYVLHVDASGALLASKSGAGLFYAVQTLRQLLRPKGPGLLAVPRVSICDWPAMRYRAMQVDLTQGPVASEETMKLAIRTAAEHKLNVVSFYVEHLYTISSSPLVAPAGAEVSMELMKRMVAYARPYHVELLPQMQTFGHLHQMLKWERYSGMAENPHGEVLAPGDGRAYEWIAQAARELAAAFPIGYLHIGGDETWELGRGRSRQAVAAEGVGNIYLKHFLRTAETAQPLGKRLMFWSDIALKHPEIIPQLPRSMVAMVWDYSDRSDFAPLISPFRQAGLEVWVCPGVSGWKRIFPNYTVAAANINRLVRDGKKLGAMGMLNTHWADDGETLFSLSWYGLLLGAAASWQTGEIDQPRFDAAFDWAFYRLEGDAVAGSIRHLDSIHQLLNKAGAGDALDEYFWTDPFSRYGHELARKAYPAAAAIRQVSEQALVDLAEPSRKAPLHRETIAFLEFAARRLDTLALKFQAAHEIGEYYRDAQANLADKERVQQDLRLISWRDGRTRVEDVLDAVVELKGLLKTVWLAENRPYYLENILLRYDREARYWLEKAAVFADARREYDRTGKLPEPEALGLYFP